MAEWASFKHKLSLRTEKNSVAEQVWILLLGFLLARGSALDLYPFGIAFGAALLLNGKSGTLVGLLGVILGYISLVMINLTAVLQSFLILLIFLLTIPRLRGKKRDNLYLGLVTLLVTGSVSGVILSFGRPDLMTWIKAGLLTVLTSGLAIIFWNALRQKNAFWRGEFTKEQGISWLLILTGILSGLSGLNLAGININVVLLTFFIVFIADRFGAGTASGAGVLLGFLFQLEISMQNLMQAGVYGLAGFITGAFQKLGKIGMALAYAGTMLMLTVYYRPESLNVQLASAALGLLLYILYPKTADKPGFLKEKPIPEVESTVAKVKTFAEIFDQIAFSALAAEQEIRKAKPEFPEWIDVLVERVCKNCPTMETCWSREFYKSYHYLFQLLERVEQEQNIRVQDLPLEWKRHCGRLKEMLLGVQFIIEHEKSLESWKSRLTANQEALARQFQSVSQVIGHLAKELHCKHNSQPISPGSLARRRRHILDIGVCSFNKSGNPLSGDNYASLAYSPTQHAFIVSDGMGVGEDAAKLSSTALNLLEQLLCTGFEPESAVQALNALLVLRSPEETFVTLDMGILELESNQMKLIKVGACPSYIKRRGRVDVYATSSLPAGILNHIDVAVIEVEFNSGDYYILVTDGVQDVLKDGKDWLKSYLEENTLPSAQETAEGILGEARRLCRDHLEDDGVVLVVRKNLLEN